MHSIWTGVRFCRLVKSEATMLEFSLSSYFVDYKSEADVKDRVLIHLRRRYLLTFDPHTQRFNIQGILRECVHTYFALSNVAGKS